MVPTKGTRGKDAPVRKPQGLQFSLDQETAGPSRSPPDTPLHRVCVSGCQIKTEKKSKQKNTHTHTHTPPTPSLSLPLSRDTDRREMEIEEWLVGHAIGGRNYLKRHFSYDELKRAIEDYENAYYGNLGEPPLYIKNPTGFFRRLLE